MLVDLINKFFVIDVTSTYNNDVITKEVGGVEIS
jgi:hypothetical protein